MKVSFNHTSYLQDARNMYRQEIEKRHKDALIECFSENFSNLNQQDQEAMKQDLIKELQASKKKLTSAKGKEKEKLEKDVELFSILAKELRIKKYLNNFLKAKLALNDFFQKNKQKLVGKTLWIDGVAWKVPHINKDGTLQFQKKEGKNEKSNFKAISSFSMLKNLGQVN